MDGRATGMSRVETSGDVAMFFFYFNKLGWPGSIALSVALTLALILAFRLLSG